MIHGLCQIWRCTAVFFAISETPALLALAPWPDEG